MPNRSVLLVCRSVRGGMKQHICNLAEGLVENSFNVTIAGPPVDFPFPSQVNFEILPIPENPITFEGLSTARKITRLIKNNNFQLIHTHGYVAGIIGRTAALKARNYKLIHTVHNFHPGFSPLTLYGARKVEVWLSRYTNRIITVSKHLKNDLIKMGIPEGKIETIYNGINTSFPGFEYRQRTYESLNFPSGPFTIGATARLIPAKGIDLFLQALAVVKKKFPSIRGIIAGDGPETANLQKLAENLGIANVVLFLGYRTDIPELLSTFDLFIAPSRQEGFGISILEAQFWGLPVIASDTGGIPEIISHGKNGLLFPPGDYRTLSGQILFLLQNQEYRQTLGLAGRKTVLENYTAEKMVQSTLQLYREVIES